MPSITDLIPCRPAYITKNLSTYGFTEMYCSPGVDPHWLVNDQETVIEKREDGTWAIVSAYDYFTQYYGPFESVTAAVTALVLMMSHDSE